MIFAIQESDGDVAFVPMPKRGIKLWVKEYDRDEYWVEADAGSDEYKLAEFETREEADQMRDQIGYHVAMQVKDGNTLILISEKATKVNTWFENEPDPRVETTNNQNSEFGLGRDNLGAVKPCGDNYDS